MSDLALNNETFDKIEFGMEQVAKCFNNDDLIGAKKMVDHLYEIAFKEYSAVKDKNSKLVARNYANILLEASLEINEKLEEKYCGVLKDNKKGRLKKMCSSKDLPKFDLAGFSNLAKILLKSKNSIPNNEIFQHSITTSIYNPNIKKTYLMN